MAPTRTYEQVGDCLRRLGHYRVSSAVIFAAEENDGVGGHHTLALCLRESNGRNVNGDRDAKGHYHAKGAFQITDYWHKQFLGNEKGCVVDTWKPVPGHTALEQGYAPRWTPAMVYATDTLADNRAYAIQRGVPKAVALRVAFNGYNMGIEGAIKAYHSDPANPDRFTTGGDYGAWCLTHAKMVDRWLDEHPNWRERSS